MIRDSPQACRCPVRPVARAYGLTRAHAGWPSIWPVPEDSKQHFEDMPPEGSSTVKAVRRAYEPMQHNSCGGARKSAFATSANHNYNLIYRL